MDPILLYLQAFFEREKVVSTWPFYVDRKICAAVENVCNADLRVPYLEGRGRPDDRVPPPLDPTSDCGCK